MKIQSLYPPVFLSGEKVDLCPLRVEDAPRYQEWINDKETAEFLFSHKPITLEKEKSLLETMVNTDPGKNVHCGIWRKESRELIGNTSLVNIEDRHRFATLGIFLGKPYWNAGFGTEAMRMLVRYGFDSLNLRKIVLHHWDFNHRGHRAYVKVGFREAGRLHEHRYIAGQWRDEVIMELMREDFRMGEES